MGKLEDESLNPDWNAGGRVHNWRKYVSEEVQRLWNSFSHEQKSALYRQADEIASSEEWE